MGSNARTDQLAAKFRSLDEDFFDRYALGKVGASLQAWKKILSENPNGREGRLYRDLLRIVAVVAEPSVRNYLHADPARYGRLGARKRECMDAVTLELGLELPIGSTAPASKKLSKSHRPAHVALFFHLHVPSEAYHFAVMRSIVHAVTLMGMTVSVHDLPETGDRYGACKRAISNQNVDLAVIVRFTPDLKLLELFEKRSIPVALVHAERLQYPHPVVAHVVPTHEHVGEDIGEWLALEREDARQGGAEGEDGQGRQGRDVVIVAMEEEMRQGQFEPLDGVEPCIRNARRRAIEAAIAAVPGMVPVYRQVSGYSHRHAIEVFKEFPNAYAYVCLSDPIAIELKHLLEAAGKSWRNRVIGYDNGKEAAAERISSFDMGRDQIGERVRDALCVAREKMLEGEKPGCEEIEMPTRLEIRQ